MRIINFLYTLIILTFVFYLGGLMVSNESIIKPYTIPSSSSNSSPVNTPVPNNSNFNPTRDTSRNWSGYVATGGAFTSVTATWIIPKISDNSSYGADAAWVGIGGVSSQDLIQAGTQGEVDRTGQVTYEAFYETLPDVSQPLKVLVNGGDSVTVSLKQLSSGQWIISFKNNTNGEIVQITQNYDSSLSSAEWVEEAPSGIRRMYPLDNFGLVRFTNGSTIKNGKTISIADANATPVTMADNFGQTLAVPSTLENDGASFSVARTNTTASSESYITRRFRRFLFGQDTNENKDNSQILPNLIQKLLERLKY